MGEDPGLLAEYPCTRPGAAGPPPWSPPAMDNDKLQTWLEDRRARAWPDKRTHADPDGEMPGELAEGAVEETRATDVLHDGFATAGHMDPILALPAAPWTVM